MKPSLLFLLPALLASCLAAPAPLQIGVAKIDITPELPIRLSGYSNRPTEATQLQTRLFARAMAIGAGNEPPVVLITAELIGIGAETSENVSAILQRRHGLERARIAFCATHVHSGPALTDAIPFMFARDLPPEENRRIEQYTARLRERLVQVAEAALADRKPGRLAWSEGRVDFATQRRVVVDGKWSKFGVVPGGPVDHALPVLRAMDARGALRALFVNYACHCTTITGAENFVHHDWAGDASQRLERAHDGAVVLVALGCGADANPNPRAGVASVAGHGEKVANEVQRLLAAGMRELGPVTASEFREIDLPLDRVVSRAELEKRRTESKGPEQYTASRFLARIDSGGSIPTAVSYPVQTWTFGRDLAMVFLGGEVVSEYALRLKRELDGGRVWVNAYANALPCYIASRRMFSEGGYEVDSSMNYYALPTRLAIGTEDRIIQTVHDMLPPAFRRMQN